MNDSPQDQEQAQLEALSRTFASALKDRRDGRLDDAEDKLRGILKNEPRLAEPRIELGRILLDTDRLEQAEEHTREALSVLLTGGQWTEDLDPKVVLGLCHAQLAEVLRRRADEDDIIFGDPDVFHAMVKESQGHFEKAAALDPSDALASYYAFFMGLPGVVVEPAPKDDD